jgi:signal transduction histidine kinase/FixJ family two-component response regulator
MAKKPVHGIDQHTLHDNGQVADEQLRMIWSHVRMGVLVASSFALVLGLTLRGVVASTQLVDGWLIAKLGVSLFRVAQGWQFARLPANGHHWERATLIALIADGAIWGAAGLYVAIIAPWPLVSFIAAALACISCVATFGLQVSARFTAGYATPILAPMALGMLIRGEALGQLGGVGLLMLLGLQLVTAKRTERRVLEGIGLRLRAEALARDKEEALKTAMRQSAVKTQFLANISHELRTPLHGILGLAKLLHMEVKEPALAQRAELIESSGTHLLTLINDLLDISRIEAGQFLVRSEPHDLHAQVEQLKGIYTMRTADKGLAFAVYNQLPTPCWVTGDPARVRQVLHNLLGNAVKFTPRGAVTLRVNWDAASGMLRAEVQDTGIGIAHHDLDKIFDAFAQSSASHLEQASDGVGLGLTIARDIARAMGGDLTAQSTLGTGSAMVFTACLPQALAPVAPSALARQPSPRDESATHCLVLLAEDNDINAMVAMNFLELIGVEAERVQNGQEAVQQALRSHDRPNIILMDCQMPVLNGYEATRAIRLQERRLGLRRIPVIALTATASDAERQDCLDAGMDEFLTKPCMFEDMRNAILRWSPNPITHEVGKPLQAEVAQVESSASLGAPSRT